MKYADHLFRLLKCVSEFVGFPILTLHECIQHLEYMNIILVCSLILPEWGNTADRKRENIHRWN